MAQPDLWHFRLYFRGVSRHGSQALNNLRALCEMYVPGGYSIDLIDLTQRPEKAKEDDVVATPMIVRVSPPPLRRFVGTLADEEHAAHALGLRGGGWR